MKRKLAERKRPFFSSSWLDAMVPAAASSHRLYFPTMMSCPSMEPKQTLTFSDCFCQSIFVTATERYLKCLVLLALSPCLFQWCHPLPCISPSLLWPHPGLFVIRTLTSQSQFYFVIFWLPLSMLIACVYPLCISVYLSNPKSYKP